MKPRMSVGRCCCDGGVIPPPTYTPIDSPYNEVVLFEELDILDLGLSGVLDPVLWRRRRDFSAPPPYQNEGEVVSRLIDWHDPPYREHRSWGFTIQLTKAATSAQIRCITIPLLDYADTVLGSADAGVEGRYGLNPYQSSTAIGWYELLPGFDPQLGPPLTSQRSDLRFGQSVPWPSWQWGKTDIDNDPMIIPSSTVFPIINALQNDAEFIFGTWAAVFFEPVATMGYPGNGASIFDPATQIPQPNGSTGSQINGTLIFEVI